MSLHRSFLFALLTLPVAAAAACSASNGEAIPNEVRDAGNVEPGEEVLPDGAVKPKDSGGGNQDSGNPKNDSGGQDAASDSPAANPVVINEVYVTNSTGDNTEFVELRGTPGTSLADLKLRLLDKNGQVKYEVACGDANDVFPVDGLWSVGGTLAFDHSAGLGSWGLENERGAVQLVRGANKELLDVVGWAGPNADAGTLPSPGSAPFATGEGAPVLRPSTTGKSMGRKTGAADTNNNQADFCSMSESAGAAQKPCD